MDKQLTLPLSEASKANKCGKCQNHGEEVEKKGHARECPFKKCSCLKCRLLDARSDILQVISGKETKLKGTKKDPHCGFCQNHHIMILRKGHVRSCEYGQEHHFKRENCFECEVHYIRNEVNRLQIKMRRAMKEDKGLTEEQKRTAREAIGKEEVEKVCDMARLARRKRDDIMAAQQVEGDPAMLDAATRREQNKLLYNSSPSSSSCPAAITVKDEHESYKRGIYAEHPKRDLDDISLELLGEQLILDRLDRQDHKPKKFRVSEQESRHDAEAERFESPLAPNGASGKTDPLWRPWALLEAQQILNKQIQMRALQRHPAQLAAGLQFIDQSQPQMQQQAQPTDCTVRPNPFAPAGCSTYETFNSYNGASHNPMIGRKTFRSVPDIRPPVNYLGAMQQASCSGLNYMQMGDGRNELYLSGSTGTHASIQRANQMLENPMRHQQRHSRVIAYGHSTTIGSPDDHTMELPPAVMNDHEQTSQANDDISSAESISPVRVTSPPIDPANIHINFNLGTQFNNNNNNNSSVSPQNQALSLVPQISREQQFFSTLQLFRLMLQFSAQNQKDK